MKRERVREKHNRHVTDLVGDGDSLSFSHRELIVPGLSREVIQNLRLGRHHTAAHARTSVKTWSKVCMKTSYRGKRGHLKQAEQAGLGRHAESAPVLYKHLHA